MHDLFLGFYQHILNRKAELRVIRVQSFRPVLELLLRFTPKAMLFLDDPSLHRVACGVENGPIDNLQLGRLRKRVSPVVKHLWNRVVVE
jgi:hypothetical protein